MNPDYVEDVKEIERIRERLIRHLTDMNLSDPVNRSDIINECYQLIDLLQGVEIDEKLTIAHKLNEEARQLLGNDKIS